MEDIFRIEVQNGNHYFGTECQEDEILQSAILLLRKYGNENSVFTINGDELEQSEEEIKDYIAALGIEEIN